MPVEPGIVDANVLVYALDSTAPQLAASRVLLDAARKSGTTLYVTSQVLYEFYAVVTIPGTADFESFEAVNATAS